MPSLRKSAAGPMPDICRIAGEPKAPAARMTSPAASAHEFTVDAIANAGHATADHVEAFHESLRDDREIGPPLDRIEECLRGGAAAAVSDHRFEIGDALVVAAVVIGGRRDARFDTGVLVGIENRPANPRIDDRQFAAGAVRVAGAAEIIFAPFEIREHIVPAPPDIALLAPAVEVERMAAHIDHAVDRRRSAKGLAARHFDHASAEMRLRLAAQAPIATRIAEDERDAERHFQPKVIIRSAGFEQQNAPSRVGREPVGNDASRGPGTDNDVIENVAGLRHAHVSEIAEAILIEAPDRE